MPEIKHTFHAGKMNKDVDERLIPNGEYRDALNIQIRTTSDGNAGTAQNIPGNSKVGESYNTIWTPAPVNGQFQTSVKTTCIGSIVDEKNDKAYFFMAAPSIRPPSIADILHNDKKIFVDSIIEQHVDGTTEVIVVDRFKIFAESKEVFSLDSTIITSPSGNNPASGWTKVEVTDASQYRVGMTVRAYATPAGNPNQPPIDLLFNEDGTEGAVIRSVDTVNNTITFSSQQFIDIIQIAEAFEFSHPRMLQFNPSAIITGINIIDNLLFWTDGVNEPKKINIDRCKLGSNQDDFSAHTKLFVSNPSTANNTVEVSDVENIDNTDLLKEHITVIRKAPLTAPTLIMKEADRDGPTSTNIEYSFVDISSDPPIPSLGDNKTIVFDEILAYEPGDVITFTSTSSATELYSNILTMKAVIIEGGIEYTASGMNITFKMIGIDPDINVENNSAYLNWAVKLEQKKPFYHLKLGRFAYRYKYDDGEYSTFSPWSELAFLPGRFSYTPSKGFNNGMVNNLRRLTIKDFIPHNSVRPSDVKTIDILYKMTDSAIVYVVKSITREIDPEWELFVNGENENTGSFTLTSEMIHSVLPSNQILRAWDNVPLNATAQEITGSRLIYGNYTQGYNIQTAVGLEQMLNSSVAPLGEPNKSVKSLRSYKWGMVFGDKYGRETPVISSGFVIGGIDSPTTVAGDITISKEYAASANSFKLKQNWGDDEPPVYFDYVKYYVKETANEYYNLIMDRWYDAKDGNVWLSFPSADRNKVDEETYLILKNRHGSQSPIVNKARYRVIAIENEAPDYIKLDERNMGKVLLLNSDVYSDFTANDTASALPDLLMNETEIDCGNTQWNSGGGLKFEDFKGIPKVRIHAVLFGTDFETELATTNSKWVTLSRLIRVTSTTGTETIEGIVVKEKFGSSANSLSVFQGMGYDISAANVVQAGGSRIRYNLEFKDEVLENKPEFDGRFFVKVERDFEVENSVMGIGTNQYDIVDSFDIAYIESKQFNPALDGANNQASFAGAEWDATSAGMGAENFEGSEVNGRLGRDGYQDVTTAFWSDWYNSSLRPAKIFIDGVRALRTTLTPVNHPGLSNPGWLTFNQNYDPNLPVSLNNYNTYELLTNSSFLVSQGGDEDGTPMFDAAMNGEAWFPQISQPNGILNPTFNPDAVPIGTQPQSYGGGPNPFPVGYYWSSFVNFNGNYSGAFQNPHLSLSKGQWSDIAQYFIHDNSSTMGQITFSALSIGEVDATHSWPLDIINFRNRMSTPGTRFKFREEPGEVVYEVISIVDLDWGYFEAYSSAGGETFDFNPNEWSSGYPNDISLAWDDGMSPAQWKPEPNGYGFINNKSIVYNGSGDVAGTGWYGNDSGYNIRSSFMCRFRRVDPETGQIALSEISYTSYPNGTAEGIDVTQWDPRGAMRHDGSTAISIDILDKSIVTDADDDEEVFSIGGCWETEPKKKETDLELYYEASNAIPMVLNEDNITSFAPSRQRTSSSGFFSIENRVLNILDTDGNASSTEQVNIVSTDGIPFVNDINGLSIQLMQGENAYTETARIDDVIIFEHPNGDKTKTKILDYYNVGDDGIAVPTRRKGPYGSFMSNTNGVGELGVFVSSGTFSTNPISPNYPVGLHVYDTIPNSGGLILGQYVEKGTSVTGISIGFTASGYTWYTITLNRPLVNLPGNYFSQQIVFIKPTGWYRLDPNVWNYSVELGWFNCYSYGNGVESNRIGDDFNAAKIDNGVKVSTTFLEYNKEKRGSGIIYSGLYNSTSGVNNLNEFNMAEKITKDLNPSYGSIQAMKTRGTDVVVFTEDKVLKVLSNKDAVFNADGNTQLTATNRVLGTAIPFIGDYGISKNPESLAWDQYRMYFTDKQRGAVLRLSNDGLTPISNVGMKTWFRDHLKACNTITGSFDKVNGEYNVTLNTVNALLPEDSDNWKYKDITVSFNEGSKGWVSFKSFVPKTGCSVSGKYFTAVDNGVWQHYHKEPSSLFYENNADTNKNYFYNSLKESSITVVFNDLPSIVKSFKSLNYEGTDAKVESFTSEAPSSSSIFYEDGVEYTDGEYYNLNDKQGWYVESFKTDIQDGNVFGFLNKENKWFNKINGKEDTFINGTSIKYNEFSVQGIGFPTKVTEVTANTGLIIIQNDPNN